MASKDAGSKAGAPANVANDAEAGSDDDDNEGGSGIGCGIGCDAG